MSVADIGRPGAEFARVSWPLGPETLLCSVGSKVRRRAPDHPAAVLGIEAAVGARTPPKDNSKGFALIDKSLAGKDWIVGDFSLADPALKRVLKTGLPANVEKHFERIMDRGAARKALKDEGL